MQEVDNVIRILKETLNAIDRKDSSQIKNLSDQTIHTAAISQDHDNVIVAVLVYSIGKIIEREYYKEMDGWNEFYSKLLKNLNQAIDYLEQGNVEKFRDCENRIRKAIADIDSNLREYIEDVYKKAQINKASKIYEHGLSMEMTAELLGVSLWDVASYIGQSRSNEIVDQFDAKKRIKIAEDFFK